MLGLARSEFSPSVTAQLWNRYVLLREGVELKLCHLFYSGYSAVTIHTVTYIVQCQEHPLRDSCINDP
ncbi:hypothetical protein ScPMuIL_007550 [Solemya velum]